MGELTGEECRELLAEVRSVQDDGVAAVMRGEPREEVHARVHKETDAILAKYREVRDGRTGN